MTPTLQERQLIVAARQLAMELRLSKAEHHRKLGDIMLGLCAIIYKYETRRLRTAKAAT